MLERGYEESIDHVTRARAIVLAVVIAIATVIGVELAVGAWLDRHGTNLGYRYIAHKWRVLGELDGPVDWLVLGDSSVAQAFDPEVLATERGKTSVNLGTIGNFGATGDLWMLEEYLERFGAPERVVLVHAYDVWHRPLDRALIGRVPRTWATSARIREQYEIEGDELIELVTNRWVRIYAERTSIRKALELAWWKLVKDDDELAAIRAADRELPRTEPTLEPNGFVRMCDPIPGQVAGDTRGHRKFLAKNRFRLSRDNQDALVRIAELAALHGFPVDIVPGPLYRRLAVEDDLERYLDAAVERQRRLLEPYAGVTVHRELRAFDSGQMQNADHITCDAAPDYTRWLSERVDPG